MIGTPNEWLAETISEALEEAAEQQTEQLSDVKFTGTASGTQVIQKCGSTENTKLESGKSDRKMVYLQNRNAERSGNYPDRGTCNYGISGSR